MKEDTIIEQLVRELVVELHVDKKGKEIRTALNMRRDAKRLARLQRADILKRAVDEFVKRFKEIKKSNPLPETIIKAREYAKRAVYSVSQVVRDPQEVFNAVVSKTLNRFVNISGAER